jgi:hypothetical protein
MSIKKILYSKNSPILISILFGIGIISFIYACSGEDCIVYKGPKKEELDKIYRMKDSCMKYNMNLVKCNNNKKQVEFA